MNYALRIMNWILGVPAIAVGLSAISLLAPLAKDAAPIPNALEATNTKSRASTNGHWACRSDLFFSRKDAKKRKEIIKVSAILCISARVLPPRSLTQSHQRQRQWKIRVFRCGGRTVTSKRATPQCSTLSQSRRVLKSQSHRVSKILYNSETLRLCVSVS